MSMRFFMRPRWARLRSKVRQSAIKASLLLVVGCGKLLGLDEDAEDEKPAPPAIAGDAAADAAAEASNADGGTIVDAAADAGTGVWRCVLDPPGASYTSEADCDAGRMMTVCQRDVPPPAKGAACALPPPGTLTQAAVFCSACGQLDVGEYTFSIARCSCVSP